MEQVNLSNSHNPDWALFLPAVSSFYIAGLGKQRKGENYRKVFLFSSRLGYVHFRIYPYGMPYGSWILRWVFHVE